MYRAITAGNVRCSENDLYHYETAPKEINWVDNPELAGYYNEIKKVTKEQIEGTAATRQEAENQSRSVLPSQYGQRRTGNQLRRADSALYLIH